MTPTRLILVPLAFALAATVTFAVGRVSAGSTTPFYSSHPGKRLRHHPGGRPADADWRAGVADPTQGEPDAGRTTRRSVSAARQ